MKETFEADGKTQSHFDVEGCMSEQHGQQQQQQRHRQQQQQQQQQRRQHSSSTAAAAAAAAAARPQHSSSTAAAQQQHSSSTAAAQQQRQQRQKQQQRLRQQQQQISYGLLQQRRQWQQQQPGSRVTFGAAREVVSTLEYVTYIHGNRTFSPACLLAEGLTDKADEQGALLSLRVRLVSSGRVIRASELRVLRGGVNRRESVSLVRLRQFHERRASSVRAQSLDRAGSAIDAAPADGGGGVGPSSNVLDTGCGGSSHGDDAICVGALSDSRCLSEGARGVAVGKGRVAVAVGGVLVRAGSASGAAPADGGGGVGPSSNVLDTGGSGSSHGDDAICVGALSDSRCLSEGARGVAVGKGRVAVAVGGVLVRAGSASGAAPADGGGGVGPSSTVLDTGRRRHDASASRARFGAST